MKITLGENLKRMRTERGLTQGDLAAVLSVTPQSVSRWETGQAYPDTEMLPVLASYFSVTLDELMLPGTLISGKVQFASGTKGGWQIDQMGRFAWNSLEGQPTPEELQAFQFELTQILSRGGM